MRTYTFTYFVGELSYTVRLNPARPNKCEHIKIVGARLNV